MERIRIARLRPDATLPTRKHPADAGMDLYAAETLTIAAAFGRSSCPAG